MATRLSEIPKDYSELLQTLTERIRTAQVRAALQVNRELVLLYWQIGRDILARQRRKGWGAKVIDRLAADLGRAFPDMRGFSSRNLKYMRTFAAAWPEESIVQQLAAQIPWFHNCVLLDKLKASQEREWYIRQTIEHGWSRSVLLHQIESGLYQRQGKALHTFRYGRMPHGNIPQLCAGLAAEVRTLLRKRPILHVILLADGAPELWHRLEEALNSTTLGVPVHRLVDLWHLLEKLGKTAQVLYGERQASRVLQTWRLGLLNRPQTLGEIWAELQCSELEDVIVGASRPVHEAITYLENHQPYLNYAAARKRGLPVGSGNVEATCKSLVAVRMKRPGARWKEDSGAAVLHLRALALSDRWNAAMSRTLRPLRKTVLLAA